MSIFTPFIVILGNIFTLGVIEIILPKCIDFDEFELYGFEDYDKPLASWYGDYMTPPPVEKRNERHRYLYLNLKEGLPAEEVEKRLKVGETIVI